MYAHSHERGTRRQTRQASSWYDAIAEATLAELDRRWPESTSTPQEDAPIDPTKDAGSRSRDAGMMNATTHE